MMKDKDTNRPLQETKRNNPFSTPEGYFEGFEQKLMNKINEEEGNIKVPVIQMMKPFLYIAAGFLLFFAIGRAVLTKVDTTNGDQMVLNELSSDIEMEIISTEVDDFTITNYLLENDVLENEYQQ